MKDKNREFPAYRKLPGAIRLYKIDSEKVFHEKQRMGNQILTYETIANQYPEMLRIQDMLDFNGFEISSETEWENF